MVPRNAFGMIYIIIFRTNQDYNLRFITNDQIEGGGHFALRLWKINPIRSRGNGVSMVYKIYKKKI